MIHNHLKNLLQILEEPKSAREIRVLLNMEVQQVNALLSTLREHNWVICQDLRSSKYYLEQKVDFLDKYCITQLIKTIADEVVIDVLDYIDSTNNYLLRRSYKKNKQYICLAEAQTSGKGRLGKKWHSPLCQNIYLSLSFKTARRLDMLTPLCLVIGLAVINTLESVTHEKLRIKWPNDIYHNHKKLAGILIETKSCLDNSRIVVVGIGLNVNMMLEKNNRWTSLREITNTLHNRNKIAAALIENLILYTDSFLAENFSIFYNEWKKHDFLVDKFITVHNKQHELTGEYVGVDMNGNILLRNKSIIKSLSSEYGIKSIHSY